MLFLFLFVESCIIVYKEIRFARIEIENSLERMV